MFKTIKRIFIKGKKTGARMYQGSLFNRLSSNWVNASTSQDTETIVSLRMLRDRARQLIRDNEFASNVVSIIQNNVVGATGINLRSMIKKADGTFNEPLNAKIEGEWRDWCKATNCHTGGTQNFDNILRIVIAQLVEAGEFLTRKIPAKFGNSKVPLALELIESDRLIDTMSQGLSGDGNMVRMGVEIDEWGRPQYYNIYAVHPGDYSFISNVNNRILRVPANEIIHIFKANRVPETRGVSWMHSVIDRLNHIAGYEKSELVAARAGAAMMGFITSPVLDYTGDGADQIDPSGVQQKLTSFEPGKIEHLQQGENFQAYNPNRPNAALPEFMRYMLRAVAVGVGVSYESLTKDYSQSNFSSSRLSLIDDRDRWRFLQNFLIDNYIEPIFSEWLDAAMLVGLFPEIKDYYKNQSKYKNSHQFKARGWGWIDPVKEVDAYTKAVQSGFTTASQVIAEVGNGLDVEDVYNERRAELDLAQSLDLSFTTQISEKEKVNLDTAAGNNNIGDKPATTNKPTPKKEELA